MSRGGVEGPEVVMQKPGGHMGSRGEQQEEGGHEAGVGKGVREEEGNDGEHMVVVVDQDYLSRFPGLGLCMVAKRVAWKSAACLLPLGSRWKQSVTAAMTGSTRVCNQTTSHCKQHSKEMVTRGGAAVGRW